MGTSASGAAAADLGLQLTPFEALYAGKAPPLFFDDTPVRQAAETERAGRIVRRIEFTDIAPDLRFSFREPLFTKIPSPRRLAWWKKHLVSLRGPRRQPASWRDKFCDLPAWLAALLAADWRLPLPELLASPAGQRCEALLLRGLVAGATPAELAAAKAQLPAVLPCPISGFGQMVDYSLFQAVALGAREPTEVASVLAQVPRKWWASEALRRGPMLALLLPTPAERVAFAAEVGLQLREWWDVVPWLAGTGSLGLPQLRRWLDGVSAQTAHLLLSVAAESATGPGMGHFFLSALESKSPAPAAQWLRAHLPDLGQLTFTPTEAATLVPFVQGASDQVLRQLQASSSHLGQVAAASLRARQAPVLLRPHWGGHAHTPRQTVDVGVPTAELPPLWVGESRLGDELVAELVEALSRDTHTELVERVRSEIAPTVRDDFALALLYAWLRSDDPNRHCGLLTGCGRIGGDGFVHALAPLLRSWPLENQHQRAAAGLLALARVGSDAALSELAQLANHRRFVALRKKAEAALTQLAAGRGLTRDELADRVLADGGLDERGHRLFTYGSRQFRAFLTPEGKLVARLLDADGNPVGKTLASLPTLSKNDDTAAARQAKAEFAALRKTITTLTRVQLQRFETSMLGSRAWSAADFTTYIAPHPLLRSLLAGLVWAVWDDQELVATGRLADATLLDLADEPVQLRPEHTVTVAHPLDLTSQVRASWSQVLADYELPAPFPQLARPTLSLPAAARTALLLPDLPDGSVPAAPAARLLETRGWRRGQVLEHGTYYLHYWPLPGTQLTAVLTWSPGIEVAHPNASEDQHITGMYLVRGEASAQELGRGTRQELAACQLAKWGELPPPLASEILTTLHDLEH
ncbi:DUF4132 domain-containing protein [Buchananella hordeovulneris]|uniref:DUF4132 domain-containing protein n=1 Tax=Buchananella hordeovulneris TaxID=52770 RepID=UPI000F5DB312|nr:DUF4132 domain-containing protein [Buchananella hordeovulneris]RRD43271.1 DUF4132 domain-containing protein [Buchananella hordeovulneris]